MTRGVGSCEEVQMPNAIANGDTCRTPQGFWLQVTEGDWLIQVDKAIIRKTWGPFQNL